MNFRKIIVVFILFAAIFLTIYLIRENYWVVKDKVVIGSLDINISSDQEIMAFLDPTIDKQITVRNRNTGAFAELSFWSIESELYFYIDRHAQDSILKIIDPFRGGVELNFKTLIVPKGSLNCLTNNAVHAGACYGFSEVCLSALDQPYMIYDPFQEEVLQNGH